MLVGRTTREPEVDTLPTPEIVARLALLDDHLRVALPPRLMVEGVAVNELILGVVAGGTGGGSGGGATGAGGELESRYCAI